MSRFPIYTVDAFTSEPFAGNQAAVCFPGTLLDDSWMQSLAAEMNISETAFVFPEGKKYRLRWFTPTVEVELCGHATLASAHLMFEKGMVDESKQIQFQTRSGELIASKVSNLVELVFPAQPASEVKPPDKVLAALGLKELLYMGKTESGNYLIELPSKSCVRDLNPEFEKLKKVTSHGVIVTSKSEDSKFDIVSRYFAPSFGINEDPVTGSAHCTLLPYWSSKLGKKSLTCFQASARGGVVIATECGERIKLAGQAVTIIVGSVLAP